MPKEQNLGSLNSHRRRTPELILQTGQLILQTGFLLIPDFVCQKSRFPSDPNK